MRRYGLPHIGLQKTGIRPGLSPIHSDQVLCTIRGSIQAANMNDKILTLIGFANKAGKLAIGRSATENMLRANRAMLLLFADNTTEILAAKLLSRVKKKLPAAKLHVSKETLGQILGRKEVSVIAIGDFQFAKSVSKLLPPESFIG